MKAKEVQPPRFSCLACGEPWSRDPDKHQSFCEARQPMRQNLDDAESAYRVDFDAMAVDPEAETVPIDAGCYDAADVVLDAAGVDVEDDSDEDDGGGRRF